MAIDRQALEDAWKLLEHKTPLQLDCGIYCQNACCQSDEDGQGGVYLFPGEEALIGTPGWGALSTADELGGCQMLTCHAPCARSLRPLGCRIFPLTPVRRAGIWHVRLDRRAFAMCPLMEHGISGLSPAFVEAALRAVRRIAEDKSGEAFLMAWAKLERQFHAGLD